MLPEKYPILGGKYQIDGLIMCSNWVAHGKILSEVHKNFSNWTADTVNVNM